MSDVSAPIYELTLDVGAGFDGDPDERLHAVVDGELGSGTPDLRFFRAVSDASSTTRVVTRRFDNESDLQQFLELHDEALIDALRRAFGDDAEIRSRTLIGEATDDALGHCLNCDTPLTGQYCGRCGQRAQSRLISIWELVKDAFGDLFELDSRIWRTLVPLAIRPGLLTGEYLRGRRARFMPPFRMYLVLSLAFFVIAFFDPYRELGILFEEPPPETPSAELADESGTVDAAGDEETDTRITGPGFRLRMGDDAQEINDCEMSDYDTADMPGWIARRLTKARVQAVCEEIVQGGGEGLQSIVDRFVENIPAGLFVLLPIMALVLKLLYPLSRRYYVEHLLFVIHYHSFVFLVLTLEVLFTRLLAWSGLPEALGEITGLAASIYIPVYLYKAQRRVYGQGHLITLPKFILLVATYLAGLTVIVLAAGLIAAFSI